MYKVYARPNAENKVEKFITTRLEEPLDADILYREGEGDLYAHVGYLQVFDENMCHNYKVEDNRVIECTEEEKQEEVITKKQIDILDMKDKKIKQSKEILAAWLAEHPMLSEIHNPDGEYYTVTQEKQAQLTQLLMLYSISVQAGGEMQLTWNATGGVCEEWSYDELSTLSFQIAGYVLPRVKKQQTYEVRINECTTVEEVNEIEIEYDTI